MNEAQKTGVQSQAPKPYFKIPAKSIFTFAQNRVSDFSQLDAQLVGPAGERF
jgi:hypothetical protein